MSLLGKLKLRPATIVAAAAVFAVAGLLFASGARTEDLKSYDSSKKDFWLHPPDDWFMGDETKEQKGTHVLNTLPPPTGFTDDEIKATLANIKLPPGFKIELWASGLPGARQMAWGKDGTLFVGSFLNTNVYAVSDQGGKKSVKTVLKGMKMPTGLAYRDGALYVADIDKIYKYDNPEGNLDAMPQPQVVYDDLPPYIPHGWKYLAFDKDGWLYVAIGPPCNDLPAADVDLADQARQPGERPCRNRRARRPQQRRRRRRSAHRRLLVHRECARLARRRSPERQAQPHHQDRRKFRLSVLPSGRHSGSEIRYGPQVLGVLSSGAQSR